MYKSHLAGTGRIITARPRVRSVALPTQHGGWGFILEPIVLGLLAAPSSAGLWLGIAGLTAFLAHHPLTLAARDRWRGIRTDRTVLAERFATAYLGAAGGAFVLAVWLAGPGLVVPLACAAPLIGVQVAYELRVRGRRLLPELTGALAPGAMASALAIAAGWPAAHAIALWAIPAVRAVTSVLYVRTRLRLARGEAAPAAFVHAANLAGTGVLAGLAAVGLAPWAVAAGGLLLTARAIAGLSARGRSTPARVVGFQEMAVGLLLALLVALGYRLGW